jgi:hypothetical protein
MHALIARKGEAVRHQIIASARRIAGELKTTENDCDTALANNARLVATLLDARRAAGLPALTGREAFGKAVEAIGHAARARDLLIDAHRELAALNLRELATGDLSECPDDWAFALPSAVANAA